MADLVRLSCAAQNYAWGKPAKTSKVAQLLSKTDDGDNPYAELWMGTHKNGPSSVILDAAANQTQLVSEYLGAELPYLYKVLSVARALSIQAHPNKELAGKLHAERPNVYKDPNHKPEMAVALTPFEAMCGFRPAAQMVFFLNNVAEFKQIVGADIAAAFIASSDDPAQLKKVFTAVMTADKDAVKAQVTALVDRLQKQDKIPPFQAEEKNDIEFVRDLDVNELVQRLNVQYPGDVGIFAVFLLNCIRLRPGEAIFLEASLPHAYLDGDCLECMACSDNVVRAGLTPKLRDTEVLCEMLNYKAMNTVIMNGDKIAENTLQYRVADNITEFRLDRTELPAKTKESLPIQKIAGCASKYASIMLVYEGSGKVNGIDVKEGDCLLLAAKVEQIDIENAGDTKLKVARCYAPSS